MYNLLKRILFLLPPEKAHYTAMLLLKLACRFGFAGIVKRMCRVPDNPVTVAGIQFKNTIGLAAGFDKDARWLHLLALLGFGHVEVGTVTPRPQAGNPRPRLFRLKKDEALINRMGFNNAGVAAMKQKLQNRPQGLVVGGNIGKNKDTPNEVAHHDYEHCFRELYGMVDYFTVNVSSPNTPGLRQLQEKEPLLQLLQRLCHIRTGMQAAGKPFSPIFLKIAPDLQHSQLDDIVHIVLQSGIDGVVATNTTIARNGLKSGAKLTGQSGGLSGLPLAEISTQVIAYLHQKGGGVFPIIGVGGVSTPNHVTEKLQAGASLVQLYTSFIYRGPVVAKLVSR